MNIEDLYQLLRNPQNVDMMELTNSINTYHSDINSFEPLVNLIFTTQDNYLQKQATIGLGKCMKVNKEQILMNEEWINTIFQLAFFPKSDFVRENTIHYISHCIYSQDITEPIYMFLRNFQINNLIDLQSCIQLLILIINDIGTSSIDISYAIDFIKSIIEQSNNSNLQENSMILLARLSQLESNEYCINLPSIFSSAIDNLCLISKQNKINQSFKYSQFFSQFIEEEFPGFMICADETALEQFFQEINESLTKLCELLQNSAINETIRRNIVNICDSILSSFDENNFENFKQTIPQLIGSYSKFISETQSTNDVEVNLEIDNDFHCFIPFFIHDEELFSYIFEFVSEFEASVELMFIKISLLSSTFDENCKFYKEESIIYVLETLKESLTSDSEFLRSVSASAISIFSQNLKIPAVVQLIPDLIEVIRYSPTPQFLNTLNSIIESMNRTDSIFDSVLGLISEIISSNTHVFYAFQCLSSLIKGSDEVVLFHITEIYEYVKPLLEINDNGVKMLALYTISILISISPEIFTDEISNIANLIIEDLQTETPSFESIHAFTKIFSSCEKSLFIDIKRPVFDMMINLINSKSNNDEVFNFDSEEFPEDLPNLEDDTDDYSAGDSMIIASAITLLCLIVGSDINSFEDKIIELFELLDSQLSSFSSAVKSSCATGLRFILANIKELNDISNLILSRVTDIALRGILSASDLDSLQEFFISLGEIIKFHQSHGISLNEHIERINSAIDIAVNGNPMIRGGDQEKSDKSSLDFLEVALNNDELRSLVLDQSIIQDIMRNYLDSSKNQTFAFDFFSKSASLLSQETLEEIISLCSQNPSAFNNNGHALRCLLSISVHLQKTELFEMIFKFSLDLIKESKETNNEELSNSCMIVFAKLQNQLKDTFPYNELPMEYLNFVPEKEIDISNILIDFFLEIYNRVQIDASPLVRIMASTPKSIEKRNISVATLQKIKRILQKFVGNSENYEDLINTVFGDGASQYKLALFTQNMQ